LPNKPKYIHSINGVAATPKIKYNILKEVILVNEHFNNIF